MTDTRIPTTPLDEEPRWADGLHSLPRSTRRRRRAAIGAASALGVLVVAASMAAWAMLASSGDGQPEAGPAPMSAVEPTSTPVTALAAPAVTAPTATVAPEVTPPPSTAATAPAPVAPPSSAPTTAAVTTLPTPAAPDQTSDPTIPVGHQVSVPVGPDGIEYGAAALFADGPQAIAVDDRGGVHIGNSAAREILTVRGEVRSSIDYGAMGGYWISDMVAHDDELIVLESYLAGPMQERVYRIGVGGELREIIELPAEFGHEGMLFGLADTGDGRIVLSYSVGQHHAEWDPDQQRFEWVPLQIDGATVEAAAPDLIVGTTAIAPAPPASADLGRMRYAGVADDGTVVAIHEWVGTTDDGVIDAGMSAEWWTADGELLGSARLRDELQKVEAANFEFTVTSDGRAFALHTYDDRVEVYELVMQPGRITS